MSTIFTKAVVPLIRTGARTFRSASTRKIAVVAARGRVVPSANELRRTRELYNVVDDRLAAGLKGVHDGIARLEAQVVRLETHIEARVAQLEVRMETRVAQLEARMDAKMDKFATKEYVKDAMTATEIKLRNYFLVGLVGVSGSIIATGATLAARIGLFSSQEASRQDRSFTERSFTESVIPEPTAPPHQK